MKASTLNAPQQLDALVKLGLEHGLRRAADMVSEFRAERYPVRDWELGACIWCETEGKRRKATHLDIGSGTPRSATAALASPSKITPTTRERG